MAGSSPKATGDSVVCDGSEKFDSLSDLFCSSLRANDGSCRLSDYKCRVREESDQEARRRKLLQDQKDKRNKVFNDKRNVLEKKDEGQSDHWKEEEMFIENEEDDEMEWTCVKVEWHKRGKKYSNMIMYSEWFNEIPGDFSEKWIMVPCPVGKRNLLITKRRNQTLSVSKKGVPICHFKSSLPDKTILDSIWCSETNSFYIIDVIQWNGMSFLNCQTDFRFYWLDSKFRENQDYSGRNVKNNYPLIKLPRCVCNENDITSIISSYPIFPNNSPKLDGLLFYHAETHYTPGYTPLVGWLKGYMIPDTLGIPVPMEYINEKPDNYINIKQFTCGKDEKRKSYYEKKLQHRKNKMACEENVQNVDEANSIG